MQLLATKYFGTMPCQDTDAFSFPEGLPGFAQEKSFVLIDVPDKHPLVFLQSTGRADLCFLAFPVLVAAPKYHLAIQPEDLRLLGLQSCRQPVIGPEVLVLALLSVSEGHPATANLLAPVVINLSNRMAVQAIRSDFRYSHQHTIGANGKGDVC